MKVILLNPFSHSLGKSPLQEVAKEPIYTKGDYKIYNLYDRHFVHTFKNIVIAERCSINKNLLSGLNDNIKPVGEASIYHDFERPKWAIHEGVKIAKQINFTVN